MQGGLGSAPTPARAAAVGVVLAMVLAGCLASPGALDPQGLPAVAERVAPEAWKGQLSALAYEGIVSTVHRLAADDGTQLSLTLHLPAGLPEGAQVPTLLQITPYQSGRVWSDATGTTPPFMGWQDYVFRGAAYVEADARGTNGSEGCLDFGGSKDRADAASFVRWVREQPWSNGIVVTDGVSHPGMGSVVAHAAVPDLTAALTHAPVVSYYRDEWYQGAKFEDQFNGPAYQGIELNPAFYFDAEALLAQAAPCTGETLLAFGQEDGPFTAFWDDKDLSRHTAGEAPILLTQGFVDQNVHPDHVQLYWDALPEDFPKYVIWGWWYHGWPDMSGHPAERFSALRHRWLDATLFGVDNGLWDEPKVLVEDSQGTWHEGQRWPLEPSETVTLWPSADGGLGAAPAGEGSVSYLDALFARRGSWDGASAVFRTEPLDAPKLVNGAPRITLAASSDQAETKWVVYLLDEAPDGTRQRVTHGYADSHTWNGEANWEDMVPGTTYTWDIMLMPTAVVVEEGHRLVLLVASQDSRAFHADPLGAVQGASTCFDDYRGGCHNPSGIRDSKSAGLATNTVHTGPEATRVTLAWVDPAATRKVPWPGDAAAMPMADAPVQGACTLVVTGPGTGATGGPTATCNLAGATHHNLTRFGSAVVEVTWDELAAGTLGVRAELQSNACAGQGPMRCSLARAEGASPPLRLTLEGDDYAEHALENLRAVVGAEGAPVLQEVRVRVTLHPEAAAPGA